MADMTPVIDSDWMIKIPSEVQRACNLNVGDSVEFEVRRSSVELFFKRNEPSTPPRGDESTDDDYFDLYGGRVLLF